MNSVSRLIIQNVSTAILRLNRGLMPEPDFIQALKLKEKIVQAVIANIMEEISELLISIPIHLIMIKQASA
jgi:hypothetical protein